LTSLSGHESLSYLNSPGLILSAAAGRPFPPSFLPARYKCRVQSAGASDCRSYRSLCVELRSKNRRFSGPRVERRERLRPGGIKDYRDVKLDGRASAG
jgi:hypothetical protein